MFQRSAPQRQVVRRIANVVAFAGTLLVAAVAQGTPPSVAATPICSTRVGSTPNITKVLWIAMENTSYGPAAPNRPRPRVRDHGAPDVVGEASLLTPPCFASGLAFGDLGVVVGMPAAARCPDLRDRDSVQRGVQLAVTTTGEAVAGAGQISSGA